MYLAKVLNVSGKCSLTTYLICFPPKYQILQYNISLDKKLYKKGMNRLRNAL